MIGWWYYALLVVVWLAIGLAQAAYKESQYRKEFFERQIAEWHTRGYWVRVTRRRSVPWGKWKIREISAHLDREGPLIRTLGYHTASEAARTALSKKLKAGDR